MINNNISFTPKQGGGGEPGGNNFDVQFNSGDTFGGISALTFNYLTNVLDIRGDLSISGSTFLSAVNSLSNIQLGADASVSTNGQNEISIGSGSTTNGIGSIALGISSNAQSNGVIAIGYHANNTTGTINPSGITIGTNANKGGLDVGLNSIAIGVYAKSSSSDSLAMGYRSESRGSRSINIGSAAGFGSTTHGAQNISIGNDSNCNNNIGALSIGIGNCSKSCGISSIAIGNCALTNQIRGIAIGSGATACGSGNLSIGEGAGNNAGLLALSNGINAITIGNVSNFGTDIGDNSITIGYLANCTSYTGNESIALGANTVSGGDYSVSIGSSANTLSGYTNQVAIGRNSTVNTQDSVAIGSCARNLNLGFLDDGACSIALGASATTQASKSIAIGANTNTTGTSSIAIGTQNKVYGACSVVIGGQNNGTNQDYVVVLGGKDQNITDPLLVNHAVVQNLAIIENPSSGNTGDNILVRDTNTGVIKQVDGSTLGGNVSGQRIEKTITQSPHGFVVGDILSSTGNTYIKSLSNITQPEPLGIVTVVGDANTFTITYAGFTEQVGSMTDEDGLALSGDTMYYVSENIAGKLTPTQPTNSDSFVKPMIYIIEDGVSGNIFQVRGSSVTSGSTGGGSADGVVSGATLNGSNVLVLNRTEGLSAVCADLSSLAGGGGGASVAGNNTEIQFNDNGAFGASSNLTFSGSTLDINGDLAISGTSFLRAGNNNTSNIELGLSANSSNSRNIAIGRNSCASGYGSIAMTIGNGSCSSALYSIAIGACATKANGSCSISIGTRLDNTANKGVNIGFGNVINSDGSIILSNNSNVGAGTDVSTIIGGANNSIFNSTNTTIVGGNNIDLNNSLYSNHTVVSNLAIFNSPVSGDASTTVMVRDGATGIIQERSQADVASSASDSRLKNVLNPITGAVEGLKSICGIEYEYNDIIKPESLKGKNRYGVIAQDLEKVFPLAVADDYTIDDVTYKSVRYNEIVPVLIEAIKELTNRMEKIENGK